MNPVFLAVIIGWIMSVCIHEYSHALVAYLAGDRSVRERGYLSMNPLLYLDPIGSILIPLVALWLGGVPLPGGAVLIDRLALRKRWYGSIVSAAGPLSNLTLFLILAAVIHPRLGLVDWVGHPNSWPTWAIFAGTMALLQLFAFLLNLLPIPPLDGFQIVEPFLSASMRVRLLNPQASMFGLIAVFVAIFYVPAVRNAFFTAIAAIFAFVGIDPWIPMDCYSLTFRPA